MNIVCLSQNVQTYFWKYIVIKKIDCKYSRPSCDIAFLDM